jgi:hypothetical protein
MKIEIATIQDVPEILELQYKAFRPVAESLYWPDAPNLTETVEHARVSKTESRGFSWKKVKAVIIPSLVVASRTVRDTPRYLPVA